MKNEKILSDYGETVTNILSQIKTNITYKELTKLVNNQTDLKRALSILIQKRFVTFDLVNDTFYYNIHSKNVKRRLYFTLYVNFVDEKYGKAFADLFEKVLLRGIIRKNKIVDRILMVKMVDCKLLKYYKTDEKNEDVKRQKMEIDGTDFLIVDYDEIEKKMFMDNFMFFLEKYYDKNLRIVFETILDCVIINKSNIMMLCSNNLNLKCSNIEKKIKDCLIFLKNDGIIIEDVKVDNYRINIENIKKIMKTHKIFTIVERFLNLKNRRLFSLILDKKYIDDKDVIKYGLVDMKSTRKILFDLLQLGVIQISYVNKENKSSMVWEADILKSSLVISNLISDEIIEKLNKINLDFKEEIKTGSTRNDLIVFVSDFLNLANDHFLLSHN